MEALPSPHLLEITWLLANQTITILLTYNYTKGAKIATQNLLSTKKAYFHSTNLPESEMLTPIKLVKLVTFKYMQQCSHYFDAV